jgi:6-phosphogluconate dehydrogenase
MKVGIIGLGRMGMNMARRLIGKGWPVAVYNRTGAKTDQAAAEGADPAYSLAELAEKLDPPRVAWLMLPAGAVVEKHVEGLKEVFSPGDIVIDGGNSFFKDAGRRAVYLGEKGIGFLDVGVSGGIWGLSEGYCLMAGGPEDVYRRLLPLFQSLSPEGGCLYCGRSGAGHFVKMVHNGIEYAMMQAYGEGFQLIESSSYVDSVDYAEVARLWNRGSVVRSWLLELAEKVFAGDPGLENIRGYVEDSGEGRWCVQQAVEAGVPAPVITQSLMSRFRSRQTDSFSDRLIAALRREFGGHGVMPAQDK